MIAILETDDPVRLDFFKTMLEAADFHPFVFDAGSPYPYLGTFTRRLLVPESEAELARRLIAEVEKSTED
jgi:hypothetical protein